MTTSITHHLKQRGAMCRMCRVAHPAGKHVKEKEDRHKRSAKKEDRHKRSAKKRGAKAAPPSGMNVDDPASVGIAQRKRKAKKEDRHKRHMRHKRGGLKLNPPSKGHKPKGAHGKAAVKALGRTKTTGNFKKIEAKEGKGAAVNAYQNALKAHKAGKARHKRVGITERLKRAGKEGSGKRAAEFRKVLSERHKRHKRHR